MDPSYPGLWPQHSNIDVDPAPPYDARSSLASISVAEVLERYQHDTDLLKHILVAKAEEDKVTIVFARNTCNGAAQTKGKNLFHRDVQQKKCGWRRKRGCSPNIWIFWRGVSTIAGTATTLHLLTVLVCSSVVYVAMVLIRCHVDSLGMSSSSNTETTPQWINSSMPMMPASQILDKTPPSPSPSFFPPSSPYTSFDVPFADLSISTSSSPEPHQRPKSSQLHADEATTATLTPPSPPPVPSDQQRERPCKRTLSRTRSQRKTTNTSKTSKRNKRVSAQSPQPFEDPPVPSPVPEKAKEEPRLDHGKVMQALRAKLQRSSPQQQQHSQQYQQQQQQEADNQAAASMSPTGILLLDLKNPRKSFPPRKPHVAAVRRPRPFASAHNYCDKPTGKDQQKETQG
ncbi:hypothetical protein BJV82DRAFT_245206 [Fennellomyces sp. T-0311]|nr:hypothetical protein BJV82DRAFT_245206 [Fennellomyces sp. T-0311]